MKELDIAIAQEYMKIKNRCKEILQDSIQSELYDQYTPNVYQRTRQLINSIKVDIIDDILYVYIDENELHYKTNSSTKTDAEVSKLVPYYVNYGHNNHNNPLPYMYNTYPSRNFILKAKQQIETEFGIPVEIIADDYSK